MNDNVFKIHVDIAGKSYGLTINRNEEALVREATKQIRHQMMLYRNAFSDPDLTDKDRLAMVALQLSIENLKLENRNDTSPFTDKITELTQELEAYLKDE